MGKVIGYKDTPNDRLTNWLTMLISKESYEAFRDIPKEREQAIAELDLYTYKKFLSDYVKDAA